MKETWRTTKKQKCHEELFTIFTISSQEKVPMRATRDPFQRRNEVVDLRQHQENRLQEVHILGGSNHRDEVLRRREKGVLRGGEEVRGEMPRPQGEGKIRQEEERERQHHRTDVMIGK